MSEKPLYHASGHRVLWQRGGKRATLETYVKLHDGKIGAHWLWCAVERIANGESEIQVMADYGYHYSRGRTAPEMNAADASPADTARENTDSNPGSDKQE